MIVYLAFIGFYPIFVISGMFNNKVVQVAALTVGFLPMTVVATALLFHMKCKEYYE